MRGKAGLFSGFVGIVVVTSSRFLSSGQETFALGAAYIALAALGIAVSNVLIKRIAGNVEALTAMGLQMLTGSIPVLLGAWAMEDPTAIRWSFTFIGALLGLSLSGTALVLLAVVLRAGASAAHPG